MASIYKAPVEDIRFALFDVLGAEAQYQRLGFANATRDTCDAVLDEAARFTENVTAPLNAVGDEHGCTYDQATGDVATPPGFKEAYAAFAAAGWTGLTGPESADTVETTITPALGAKLVVASALSAGQSVRYEVRGQIATSQRKDPYEVTYESSLNPAPGLPGVLR